MNRFIDSGILIAIFTAFLFTLSVANYNGYLSSIGIEPSFILRNSHQILYNSLFVILPTLLKVAAWGFAVCCILYPIANLYTDVLRNWIWLKKKIAKIRLKNRKIRRSRIELNSLKLIKFIFPLALGSLVFFGGLVKSENMGKESGYALIEKIKKSDYSAHEVIDSKGYKSKIYVVSCGINNCAGINVDTMKVEYFENKFSLGSTSNNVNITSTLNGT
jgi:hypothetical protein